MYYGKADGLLRLNRDKEVLEQPPSKEECQRFRSLTLFSFMDYEKIKEDLDKALIGPRELLSGTKVLTESSRESPEYLDKRNLPFWYHFGKQVSVSEVLQIGSVIGLPAACFLQSCKSVSKWGVIQSFNQNVREEGRMSNNVLSSNIKLHSPEIETSFLPRRFVMQGKGVIDSCGLAILTEDSGTSRYSPTDFLTILWEHLEPEGLLVCDYINSDAQGEAFMDFCKTKNRTPVTLKTRYGVGIIER